MSLLICIHLTYCIHCYINYLPTCVLLPNPNVYIHFWLVQYLMAHCGGINEWMNEFIHSLLTIRKKYTSGWSNIVWSHGHAVLHLETQRWPAILSTIMAPADSRNRTSTELFQPQLHSAVLCRASSAAHVRPAFLRLPSTSPYCWSETSTRHELNHGFCRSN